MSALNSFVSKENAEENSSSPTKQPAEKSVLPPLAVKLSVDKKLKLKKNEFKQTIYDSLKDKDLTPLSQLTATPPFPTPYVLAQFASKAYTDYTKRETDAHYETRLNLPDGWKLLTTASNNRRKNGYFGAAYWHPEHQHLVIAHRGTDPTNLGALWTDLQGVLRNKYVRQMESASTFAHKVVEVLREINQQKRTDFQVFFTGHSLGGWLAQITNFTTKYLKIEENTFLKSENVSQSFHPHTSVFDSPGCKKMLLQMRDTFDVRLDGRSIDIEHLDITSFLSAPNRINTCKEHVGAVYRIFPDFSDIGWLRKHTVCYNLATHDMNKIVKFFVPEKGQFHNDGQGKLKIQVVVDWPVNDGLWRRKEYKDFFKWARHLNNYEPDITDKTFHRKGYNPLRYQTKTYDEQVCRLNVFSQEECQFLESYRQLCQLPELFKPEEMFSEMRNIQAQEKVEEKLQSIKFENQTIRCTDATALHALIPYVKRLLQLFPSIKENTKCALSPNKIRNNVYQIGTKHYIEKFHKSLLDFKADALSLGNFLNSDQEKLLQLRMVDGDAWTGLIKVYKVLKKTDRLSEGHYTVLTLEDFLLVNRMVKLNTLLESTKAPHLLMMMCKTSYLLNIETRDKLRSLFNALKKNQSLKIILITQSEDETFNFLQHLTKEIVGNGLVTRDGELSWCDLLTNTQKKLLEKPVTFQGAAVSLNELMSAESAAAKFLPLGALLEEKEVTIAKPLLISNGYKEGYYIRRTLCHQKTIKQDIFNDKDVRNFHVYLARTEEEYTNLCHLHPKEDVHWVDIDKSGKLLWQQSQGSLETLRRYIDTDSRHKYTADDLDKLLEEAHHQRVMLISDTAGMGKSTILSRLSKQIKQKFPTKWVVRIDLSGHTGALEVLKQVQIDKEKAIEFVSQKLLELKPGLEMELFKQCCDQKQKVEIVIMLDGLDEISPSYKDTVIDLLQALRQTAVEQLWVTTRPHLREELENKLQQLCYTLEPFSKQNQVEFLTNFWSLQKWFTETNDKEGEKEKNNLEIYAKELINKFSNSINDKDRAFTGIPLLTCMLAEAFDKEAKMFYLPSKSKPEIPYELDLPQLYERFIERKYEIYQEEKLQVKMPNEAAKEQKKRELKYINLDHQLLALKVLFNEEQVALIKNNKKSLLKPIELERIGIVQVSHEGKPQFIHRTFAEYYVADCLVNSLTDWNNTSKQVQKLILKDIFKKKKHQVLRAFIDSLLSRCVTKKLVFKQYGNLIHDLGVYDDKILHRAALEGNKYILGFLLDSVQAGDNTDTVNKLLLEEDEDGLTAWHIALLFNKTKILEKVWECAEEKLTAGELNNKFLLTKLKVNIKSLYTRTWGDMRDPLWNLRYKYRILEMVQPYGNSLDETMSVWQLAASMCNLEVLQKVWEWAEKKLTKEEINDKLLLDTDRYGMTAWHYAATRDNSEILQKVWEWANENLTKEEINNKLLLGTRKDGKNAWQIGAKWGNSEILQKVWEWAKENLTKEEINDKLLLGTDKGGMTAWHIAAERGNSEILQKVWECAKENLTEEEINDKLLFGTGKSGMTAWLYAATQDKSNIFQKVWECAKENLTKEEIINKLLLGTDNDGRTVWRDAAVWNNLKILLKVWELAKDNLIKEEINKLLLSTDKNGMPAWHYQAEWGDLKKLQKLWEWAKENLTKEEINDKLLSTDKNIMTAWHYIAEQGNSELLQKVLEWAKENLTKEEINDKLLLGTDKDGMTAWKFAAKRGNSKILQKGLEFAKVNLTKEEIIDKLLLGTDKDGMTVWHYATRQNNSEIFQKVWEWAKENVTKEEINDKLLLGTDKDGMTTWQYIAKLGNSEILQKVWEWAKENLTKEQINKKFLLGTDIDGTTTWHYIAKRGFSEILQNVWECAKENLTKEEIKDKLLLGTDKNGTTTWHYIATRGNSVILQKAWEWAKENLTKEEIKDNLLLGTDKNGLTAWHYATRRHNSKSFQKVWEWVKENLTKEEINDKLLLGTDKDGLTAWHYIAKWGNSEILQKVWEWAKENLTKEEVNDKLLLGTDKDGKSAWHHATTSHNLEILLKVWECAKENLTKEEINNKLLLGTDINGMTAWHSSAKWGYSEILQKVWEWAKENLTKEEIKDNLLLGTDKNGRTALHYATRGTKSEILQKVWEWAKENLTKEEINDKLLLRTDKNGKTAWHYTNMWCYNDITKTLFKLRIRNLTTEDVNDKLLLGTDKEGMYALQLAASLSNSKILKNVWKWAKKNLTK